MAVRLPALCTGALYPQKYLPVFLSVKGGINPRAMMLLEGYGELKNSMTIGTRTPDLSDCRITPQQSTPPCALSFLKGSFISILSFCRKEDEQT
jgi:hypothetical protein